MDNRTYFGGLRFNFGFSGRPTPVPRHRVESGMESGDAAEQPSASSRCRNGEIQIGVSATAVTL